MNYQELVQTLQLAKDKGYLNSEIELPSDEDRLIMMLKALQVKLPYVEFTSTGIDLNLFGSYKHLKKPRQCPKSTKLVKA